MAVECFIGCCTKGSSCSMHLLLLSKKDGDKAVLLNTKVYLAQVVLASMVDFS